MKINRLLFSPVLVLLLVLSGVGVSHAQIASALIREGDTLPGDTSGFLIRGLNPASTSQNGVGGFAFKVTTDHFTGLSISNFWGNATGGTGTLLRTQSTFGDFTQTSFWPFGMSDAGTLAYRSRSISTATDLDHHQGIWLDSTLILNEGDPISTLPGNFSTYNTSAGITRDGTPYWKGGYSPNYGDTTVNSSSAIFFGTGLTVLLKGGDNISGIAETVTASWGGISFDLRFSASGTNYINEVLVDTGSEDNDGIMVSNGAAMLAGGSVIREQSSVPTSIGGLAGELYDRFDRVGITESGSYMITGNTNAAETLNEFIMIDGEIVLREGDVIDGLTLNGTINSAFQNEDGDWAAVWDVDFGTENLQALIMNSKILLLEGDLVDWNNDGLIDGSDQNVSFTFIHNGSQSLSLSDRDANGDVRLLFPAHVDLNGTDLEGGFSMSVSAVPEPSSMLVLLFVAGPMLARRRRRRSV